MASSRKRRPTLDPVEAALLAFTRSAVEAIPPEHSNPASADLAGAARTRVRHAAPLVIALSGGRDSMTLLDLAVRLRDERVRAFGELVAVHVHHGMQKAADEWVEFCSQMCTKLGVALDVRRVTVRPQARGPEAAARAARYAALLEAADEHGARLVLTAHHLDDRIETFLIQWLRGAGPEGLAAMPAVRAFETVRIVRPLLDVPRAEIEHYVALRGLAHVEDPSNVDVRLLRNSIRRAVVPALESARPGMRKAAARSIDLVAEAAEVLREYGAADLEACAAGAPEGMLYVDRLAQLTPARQALVLRSWLTSNGLENLSRARLRDLLAQALTVRADARLLLRMGSVEVRRHRGLLLLRDAQRVAGDAATVVWHGEEELAVPTWGGVLRFDTTVEEGFDVEWLSGVPLELRGRGGGERFKPHPTRPSKTLKRLFQDANVPEFERARLPLVWRGEELIYVAGLGADARLIDNGGPRVMLAWHPDAPLLGG
ncbi:MAG TPA: tRNA lysidine(34) synthetase TilS [Burkholderiaceae bacterium]|nr:tRNA lysidine(34) synthetase TilS [Burkholderiaceae bacterium]